MQKFTVPSKALQRIGTLARFCTAAHLDVRIRVLEVLDLRPTLVDGSLHVCSPRTLGATQMRQIEPLNDATVPAQRPAIVEQFAVDGLFGYRSVSLTSSYAATVLIARNGSGKTTLLAAMDAFLRGQFARFATLQFEKISCKLKGCDETLVLYREDVNQLIELTANGEFAARAKAWELEPLALIELLEVGIKDAKLSDLLDSPTFYTIYQKQGFSVQVAKTQLERLSAILADLNPRCAALRESLRATLGKIEIVYLPTYRRIELSLPDPYAERGERRRSILSRLGVARSGLYAADIQFGLGDISDRLRTLHSQMLSLSNQGYGKVSANVINDLISGDYKKEGPKRKEPPTKESLELFFSRIKDAARENRRVQYSTFFATPDLDRVYSGDVPEDAKPFLNYFLDQLNSVIQETRSSEELVEAFINSCNRYLSGDEEFTSGFSRTRNDTVDRKQLSFNKKNLDVRVTNSVTGSQVPLEALSSGEKQMISLFARLYLYPGPKLVLIDEPELSLSLDWQRQILPDVLKAPTCEQVIAITHSPFIFDNELEPFASSLQLRLATPQTGLFPSTDFSDEADEGSQ